MAVTTAALSMVVAVSASAAEPSVNRGTAESFGQGTTSHGANFDSPGSKALAEIAYTAGPSAQRHAQRASPKMAVGLRAKNEDRSSPAQLTAAWKEAVSTFGPLKVTRTFETALPAKHVPITPVGVQEIVSYKSSTAANVKSFVASMRPGTLLAFYHEPEGPTDWASGAAFVTAFKAEAAKVHAAGGTLGHIAGAFQWRKGNAGSDGSYLPPASVTDWYGFDTYRTGTDYTANAVKPLAKIAEFQSWYAAVKDRGRDLRVTEYGRGAKNLTLVPDINTLRANAFKQDGPYLESLGFKAFILWWSDYSPGKDWKFTDTGSTATWSALVNK